MIKVLFFGDIVGKAGRQCVATHIAALKQQYQPDLIIANGENAAHGKGITKRIYEELLAYGIDMITMGNHTFSKNDIFHFIDTADRLVRPGNMEPLEYGSCVRILPCKGKRVAICSISGEIFMNHVVESPFVCMERILNTTAADLYLVDLHGEATSEKIAFTYHFAGRVHAVVGTHTHVQTADERIVYGTAAISDLGMCGAYTSVLGRDVQEVITRFVTQEKTRYTIAEGEGICCGLCVTFDEVSNQAIHVERIQLRPDPIEVVS